MTRLGSPSTAAQARQPNLIADRAHVRAMVAWCALQDSAGTLPQRLLPPPQLSQEQLVQCVREEGWILGAQ